MVFKESPTNVQRLWNHCNVLYKENMDIYLINCQTL